jgi:hypothetical protein
MYICTYMVRLDLFLSNILEWEVSYLSRKFNSLCVCLCYINMKMLNLYLIIIIITTCYCRDHDLVDFH